MNNSSDHNTDQCGTVFGSFSIVFYTGTAVLGLLGNGLFLAVAVRFKKPSSDTECCLLHLTAANILLMVTQVLFLARESTLGDVGWRLVTFLNQAAFSASILMLTCVAMHQCLSVSRSSPAPSMTRLPRMLQFLFLWALALLSSVPDLILRQHQRGPGSTSDHDVDSDQWLLGLCTFVLQLILTFLAPAVLISACYVHLLRKVCGTSLMRKRQVCRVVIALLTTFYIFQLPRHLCTCAEFAETVDCCQDITYVISTLTACAHPIIYAIFWHKFRKRTKSLLWTLTCLKGSGKMNSDLGNLSSTT